MNGHMFIFMICHKIDALPGEFIMKMLIMEGQLSEQQQRGFVGIRSSNEYSDKSPFYGISPMSDIKMQKERPMNLGEFAPHIIETFRQNELWNLTYNPMEHIFEISGDRVNGLIQKKVAEGIYHPFVLLYWQNTQVNLEFA